MSEQENELSINAASYSLIKLQLQYAGCGSHFLFIVPIPRNGLIWYPDHRELPRVPRYIWFGSFSIDRDISLSGATLNGIKEKRQEIKREGG